MCVSRSKVSSVPITYKCKGFEITLLTFHRIDTILLLRVFGYLLIPGLFEDASVLWGFNRRQQER